MGRCVRGGITVRLLNLVCLSSPGLARLARLDFQTVAFKQFAQLELDGPCARIERADGIAAGAGCGRGRNGVPYGVDSPSNL